MRKTKQKAIMKKKIQKKSNINTDRNTYLLLCLIIIISIVAYSQVFRFNFVSLDDSANVLGNKQITSIDFTHIKEVFSKTYVQMYVPFTMISYMIDYFFAGKLNPVVFHFFNLLYHLLNIILVFVFIKKLTENKNSALIVSILFAVHPMNVEVVSWISTRSTLIFVGFGLLAMIFYLNYLEKNYNLRYLFISSIFFIFSLLSKSSLIVMPILLWAIDYYKGRKISKKLILDKIPFILLSLAFIIITVYVRGKDIMLNQETFSLIERLFFACYGLVFYIIKLFLPVNLSVVHPFPNTTAGWLPAVFYLSALVIPLIILMIFKSGKLKKDIIFGIIFFIANLLLVLQLIPYGYSVVSERYVYLPYLGLFLIIGQFIAKILDNSFEISRKIRSFIIPVLLLFIICLTVAAYYRTTVWKDPVALFDDAVSKQPGSHYAYYSRGVARSLFNDSRGAMSDYNKAIEINPKYAEAYAARGLLRDETNDISGALADYDKAIDLSPALIDTYYNRGNNKFKTKNFEGAIKDYDFVIKVDSTYDNAICNRGTAWLNLNDQINACKDWQTAAALGNKNAVQQLDQYCN